MLKLLRKPKRKIVDSSTTRRYTFGHVWHISNLNHKDYKTDAKYAPAQCGVWFEPKARGNSWPMCAECQDLVKQGFIASSQSYSPVFKPRKKITHVTEKVFPMPKGIPE